MVWLDLLRYAGFAVFALAAVIAFGSWAVRTRRINPFSTVGQALRRMSDPVLTPLETWLHRRGGNPQNAGWWLLGISIVGGIVVITFAEWLVVVSARIGGAAARGPRGILRLLVYYAGQVVVIALIARVIGSWFGVGRYNRWMRPAYLLTDWLVEPLRRIVPPFGMIDASPLVAFLLLQFLILPLLLGIL
ncbi:MAG: YggT family protein [Gemmatimonadales bacterium]